MASKYRKTVWVIDIFNYLTFLEECLDQIAPQYPWLLDKSPIDNRWDWMYAITSADAQRTQRDFLIDWIVRQEIHEMFYLWATNHHRSPDYEDIHNKLLSQFDLHARAAHDIMIPNMYGYGDMHPGRIWRSACWLYVECEVTASTLEQYALHPNATTGHPPKRPY